MIRSPSPSGTLNTSTKTSHHHSHEGPVRGRREIQENGKRTTGTGSRHSSHRKDSHSPHRSHSSKHYRHDSSKLHRNIQKIPHKSAGKVKEHSSRPTHKTKRKKKRSHSSSRSSSSSTENDADYEMHLKAMALGIPKELISMSLEDLERLQEERQQKKALIKVLETPEEKRARRLAKKEAKERWRRERMGWDKEYLGYTNEDNPFGDHRLSESFVWKQKLESEGLAHLSKEEIQRIQKKKMEENKLELKSVRRRRAEREREREEREKEMEMMQRDKEAEYYRTWEQQEDTFHLDQAKLRSRIRIADGRAKPIDLLAKHIADQDEDMMELTSADLSGVIDILEPTQFLVGLSIEDLEDLLEDIKVVYMELEKGRNAEYWRDITTVVEDELQKLRRLEDPTAGMNAPYGADSRGRTSATISQSVMQSVAETLKGKTYQQLAALEKKIEPKLRGGEGVDVTYWETLAQFIRAQMARTRLRDMHQENLKRKLEYLRQSQGIHAEPMFPSGVSGPPTVPSISDPSNSCTLSEDSRLMPPPAAISKKAERDAEPPDEPPQVEDPHSAEAIRAARVAQFEAAARVEEESYDPACYSPTPVDPADLELDAVVYAPEDDVRKIEYQREEILQTGAMRASEEEELMRRAREGMEDGEDAQFSVTIPVEDQSFLWSDKYRPRKPRFFNRVHTGFVWNKYNQTHYDLDNPPPKIVQGYKFNVFYPDLIDKTKTPTYTLTPCEDPSSRDFAVLRFTAGPPYEDIAFKIVNREWEYSYKHGFRCQFQNNIFQLWFHFKRFRYRR
ncbi:unnamed protein product [Dicrocoelium dendriticum]|nr:unnamed protein product [Dicrocoelium dendriticum]